MRNLIILFIILITLQSCGFKMVDQDNLGNFYIVEIKTSGEKRVNHKIRNKLLFTSNDNTRNKINVKINTKRVRNIKEKNIKNEVTKYNLILVSTIEYEDVNTKIKNAFTLSQNGNYGVSTQNSKTINSEKKLLDLLTEKISDQITKELILRLDDY
tara:strand:+ start:2942 stop:3409 length:468 start_codon:yes stop_codon:yes gene_type:complete